MEIRLYLAILCSLSLSLQADNLSQTNNEQMETLALQHCQWQNKEDCHCVANNMLERFTATDWEIFIAAINKDSSIMKHISDKEIFNFSDKLYQSTIDCGIE